MNITEKKNDIVLHYSNQKSTFLQSVDVWAFLWEGPHWILDDNSLGAGQGPSSVSTAARSTETDQVFIMNVNLIIKYSSPASCPYHSFV